MCVVCVCVANFGDVVAAVDGWEGLGFKPHLTFNGMDLREGSAQALMWCGCVCDAGCGE